jgi:hypothetical protein
MRHELYSLWLNTPLYRRTWYELPLAAGLHQAAGGRLVPDADSEVVDEDVEDGEGRDGEADGRWTNVERPNGCYNESLRKLAEQRCGGLVEHPHWSAAGLDETGRIRARVRVASEDLS